jgi:hypothetical protein
MTLAHTDPLLVLDARLRAMVTSLDAAIARLLLENTPEDHRAAMRDLAVSRAGLVELLALGLPPETRQCPTCYRVGMRAATRCGFCWIALPPPSPRQVAAEG